MTWVYEKTEPRLWTVGFYAPNGDWHTDSDHASKEDAARRTAYLNGSNEAFKGEVLDEVFEALLSASSAFTVGATAEQRNLSLMRKNTLVEVYALLSGKDPEEVHETVQEVLQERHERAIAEQEV